MSLAAPWPKASCVSLIGMALVAAAPAQVPGELIARCVVSSASSKDYVGPYQVNDDVLYFPAVAYSLHRVKGKDSKYIYSVDQQDLETGRRAPLQSPLAFHDEARGYFTFQMSNFVQDRAALSSMTFWDVGRRKPMMLLSSDLLPGPDQWADFPVEGLYPNPKSEGMAQPPKRAFQPLGTTMSIADCGPGAEERVKAKVLEMRRSLPPREPNK